MKKSIFWALVAVVFACVAYAADVTPDMAAAAARAWAARNAAFGVAPGDVGPAAHFADTNGVTLWHRVQMGTSCLIISPVTELEPVIAVLENVDANGGLPAGHPMRAMLARDMTDRLKKLGLYKPHAPAGGATLLGAAPASGAEPDDPEFAAAWAQEGEARWARLLPKRGAQLMAAREDGITEINVQVGIVDGFEKNGRYMRQADYNTPLQALKNLMGGTMRWNLWLFAVRRKLLLDNGLRFIDGANMGEDMMLMLKAFSKASAVVQLHLALYRYNAVSETSLSRQFSPERRREISENLTEAERYLRDGRLGPELEPYFQYLKLYLKLPLLISADRSDYETWCGWFPEANGSAMANKALPLRTRLLQGMAARKWWGGVKLYYWVAYRFVYGILFR